MSDIDLPSPIFGLGTPRRRELCPDCYSEVYVNSDEECYCADCNCVTWYGPEVTDAEYDKNYGVYIRALKRAGLVDPDHSEKPNRDAV